MPRENFGDYCNKSSLANKKLYGLPCRLYPVSVRTYVLKVGCAYFVAVTQSARLSTGISIRTQRLYCSRMCSSRWFAAYEVPRVQVRTEHQLGCCKPLDSQVYPHERNSIIVVCQCVTTQNAPLGGN